MLGVKLPKKLISGLSGIEYCKGRNETIDEIANLEILKPLERLDEFKLAKLISSFYIHKGNNNVSALCCYLAAEIVQKLGVEKEKK